MRLSKTLLQSIAIGVSLAAIPACSLHDDGSESEHLETCDENCIEEHHANQTYDHSNCPACGLG